MTALFTLGALAWFGVTHGQSPDPLLEQQWHLKSRSQEPAGANVRDAWPTSQGQNVVIGIVDDGLQHTHPDLQANYIASLSYDFNGNDPDPSPATSGSCSTTADCHGTAVAGVAASRGDNGIGGSGAAPLGSLAGIRLIAGPTSDAQEAAALGHEGNAIHIMSNSWGPSDDGRTLAGPGPLTQSAIQTGVTQGRGGKGRIFLWAAGNGGGQDNCNFDGYANSRYVNAVGALADTGQQASYSEPCAATFVTAPSSGGSRGITTTDLVGASGYSSTDYTAGFGGTSSATPLVSGIVALMLAKNPSLTWRDVKHILARTAVRINPTDSGWTSGTFAHNEKYGFGLVDGKAAVDLATAWINVAAEAAIPPLTRTVNLAIPDNNATGVADSITISDPNFTVEHVEVVVDITHTWRGDLEITLTSPKGVVSRLATVRLGDSGDNFPSWRFGTVRHWGESAAGVWTLRVADRVAADVGTLKSWTLRVYGTTTGATPPTVTIAATDPNAAEAGPDPGTFTVTRTGSTDAALTVNYTVGGTATPGSDYTALPGSVTIPKGSATAIITITPVDDSLSEGSETVTVTLSSGAGYTLGTPSSATVTIADNDGPIVIFQDNMENGVGGWVAQSPWALTTATAKSLIRSWTDSPAANYKNNANTSLFSPALNFSGVSSVTLTFWHRYDLESGRDFGRVWVTVNNGATYTQVASFTGTNTSWTQVTVNLSTFAGQPSVKLRFQLRSDRRNTRDGWYIDDVLVTGK